MSLFENFHHFLILSIDTFEINRERAIDYLNTRDNVYVFDGFAGVCLSPCLFSDQKN